VAKRVLFITYHFPPSAASGTHRILGFAEHLPALGWDVAVVAPPSLPWEPQDRGLVARIPAGTDVRYVDYPRDRVYWPLRKVARYSAWLVRALASIRRAMKDLRPDVVVTSGPPHCVHMIGPYLKSRFGVRWMADFRDPWMAGRYWQRNDKWRSRAALIAETAVFRRCDAIIVNAPNAAKAVVACHPKCATKLHWVTNGYDPKLFEGIAREPRSNFTIAHTGELYEGRDPRAFLDALRQILDEGVRVPGQLSVEFIGSSAAAGFDLGAEIERRRLSEVVRPCGQMPYRECLERMANARVLLLIDRADRSLGVPAKLYEYFGANRPILALAAPGSDVHWALQESGRTYCLARPDDVTGIRDALMSLLRNVGVSNDGDRFSRHATATELSAIMHRLIGRTGECAASDQIDQAAFVNEHGHGRRRQNAGLVPTGVDEE
jgi:glycosyltransferase involved in cell wall biosynthesis